LDHLVCLTFFHIPLTLLDLLLIYHKKQIDGKPNFFLPYDSNFAIASIC
jgi:hypothetical protein